MTEPVLYSGERIDDLQTGGYRIIQCPGTFCFGTDSVLLADFAAPWKKDRAVDLGCGNGGIALLMAAHQPELQVDAVELQQVTADMAARSVVMNGIEGRVRVHNVDMRTAWEKLGRGIYSLVVCNPPYGRQGSGPVNGETAVRIARHEQDLTPEEVAMSAEKLLKFGGRFCVVYPADRICEMLYAMKEQRLEPKRIRTVHARADRVPKRVLIEAIKGAKSGMRWMPPLILYNQDGTVSEEWKRIYGTSGAE